MSEERLQEILRLIENNRTISAKELEAQLYVSSATIRRDLAELARRGLILRGHGKAMALTRMAHAVAHSSPDPFDDPVGSAAAALVKPHSILFIGGGRLCLTLAKALSKVQDLTVVTDSMAIANILCGHAAHLYCAGGRPIPGRDAFSGRQAAELVASFYYQWAFFSCDALAGGEDVTYYEIDRMSVLQMAAQHAEKKTLLFSREQADAEPGASLLRLKDMDYIVTDIPGLFSSELPGAVISTGN